MLHTRETQYFGIITFEECAEFMNSLPRPTLIDHIKFLLRPTEARGKMLEVEQWRQYQPLWIAKIGEKYKVKLMFTEEEWANIGGKI